MTYLCIDTETTSLPDFSLPADAPGQPRVASLAMILCDDDLRPIAERYDLVRPDGWVMSSEALAVNGLTMEKLDAEGVPIAPVLDAYARYIDDGAAVMAYGAQFDVKMLCGEMRRLGMDDRFATTRNLCVMRACTGVCKLPRANGRGYKFPKLTEAYQHFFKRPFDFPHTALGDARACLEVARFLKRIDCLPEPSVHHAKEGTKAGAALKARQGESTEETLPGAHMEADE